MIIIAMIDQGCGAPVGVGDAGLEAREDVSVLALELCLGRQRCRRVPLQVRHRKLRRVPAPPTLCPSAPHQTEHAKQHPAAPPPAPRAAKQASHKDANDRLVSPSAAATPPRKREQNAESCQVTRRRTRSGGGGKRTRACCRSGGSPPRAGRR
eukprot:685829-Rhodomonas_salina.1